MTPPHEHAVRVSRAFPFAPSVLWDALSDPELLSGWLGPVVFRLKRASRIRLDVPQPSGAWPSYEGQFTEIIPGQLLVARIYERHPYHPHGDVRFELRSETPPVPYGQGARGITHLTLHHDRSICQGGSTGSPDVFWQFRLDLLEQLLRGNPFDFTTWQN